MAAKVKTRILIISDTHSVPLQNKTDPERPFREPLPSADVLIHCGDLTMQGSFSDYNATLDAIKHVAAPLKLVIAGNHDLTLDGEWMRTHQTDYRIHSIPREHRDGSVFREFWTGAEGRARREGVTFLDEGVHSFELVNGARLTVYASPYTPEFWDWGFPYERNHDRFNAPPHSLSDARNIARNPIPSFEDRGDRVDVMVTHGPPYAQLDLTSTDVSAGCPHLLRALMRCRPLVHCFGHIHEGWGAQIVDWEDDAGAVAVGPVKQGEWMDGEWRAGVKGFGKAVAVAADSKTMSKERSLHVDLSDGGEKELKRGSQTLLVNASIVDLGYEAVNAPVLVNVDLAKAS